MAALRRVFNVVPQGQQASFLFGQVKTSQFLAKYNFFCSPSLASQSQSKDPTESSMNETQSSSSVTRSRPNYRSARTRAKFSRQDNWRKDDYSMTFDPFLVDSLFKNMEGDKPLSDMPDPFVKNHQRCFLCEQNVHLDHKNVRLLSQFVSSYTGRIYGRGVTGLCIPMQRHVAKLIKRARMSGYMPYINKDPRYLQDPQPFDPMARMRR